jgi:glycerol kinase
VLEGIALQIADLLFAMQADAGAKLASLRVDGGAAANDLLMQFQADILGVPIVRPQMVEATALGAAMLAGIGVGQWKQSDLQRVIQRTEPRTFSPKMAKAQVDEHLARWKSSVARA